MVFASSAVKPRRSSLTLELDRFLVNPARRPGQAAAPRLPSGELIDETYLLRHRVGPGCRYRRFVHEHRHRPEHRSECLLRCPDQAVRLLEVVEPPRSGATGVTEVRA